MFIGTRSLGGRLYSRTSSQAQTEDLGGVQKQSSVIRQHSYQHSASTSQKEREKKEEEWDKDIPSVSLGRIIAVNAKEWWLILLGVIGAGVNGSVFPLFAVIFGEIVRTFALPPSQIQSELNFWAVMFIVLGFISGTGLFLKVRTPLSFGHFIIALSPSLPPSLSLSLDVLLFFF